MHGFLVRGLLAAGLFAWLAQTLPPLAQAATCLAAGALIATLLSTRVAHKFAAPMIRPMTLTHGLRDFAVLAIRKRMEQNKRLY